MSIVSPKTQGLVPMRYVVMSILNRRQDYTMRQYKRLMQLAIEGYNELSLWHLDNVEVVYLRMNEAKTVSLPADFIDYLKIGIPIEGKLRVLTRHDNILLPRNFEDGTPVGNADGGITSEGNIIFFTDHFRNGRFVGGLYGFPGGIDTAYYRVDKEHRKIVFSGTVPRSEIVLEYISSGLKPDGSSLIPRESVSALRAYVDWVDAENNVRISLNEKIRKKQIYEEEVMALRSFQHQFTADEYRRAIYGTYRQTIKR